MMTEEEGLISILIDKRDAQIYTSAEFECFQADCPLYFINHFHIWNVDLAFPFYGIWEKDHKALRRQGATCHNYTYPYATEAYLHLHLPKNEEGITQ